MNRQRPNSTRFPFIIFQSDLASICGAAILFQAFERTGQPTKGACLEYPLGKVIQQIVGTDSAVPLYAVGSESFLELVKKSLADSLPITCLTPSSVEGCFEFIEKLGISDPKRLFKEASLEVLRDGLSNNPTLEPNGIAATLTSSGYLKGGVDIALKGYQEGFDGRYQFKADELGKVSEEELVECENSRDEKIPSYKLKTNNRGLLESLSAIGKRKLGAENSVICLRYSFPAFLPGIFEVSLQDEELVCFGSKKRDLVEEWSEKLEESLQLRVGDVSWVCGVGEEV